MTEMYPSRCPSCRLVLAALALLLVAPVTSAARAQDASPASQTPPPAGQIQAASPTLGPDAKPLPPTYTIRRNVRLVVLDAVVVDRDGNAVTDLGRNDFHIAENGVPQDLRNFIPPGRYTPPPDVTINSTADLDRLAPHAPVNIVVLDEFNTRFEDMAFARYSLKKFLEQQPDKLDTPTMLVAVSLSKFTVVEDYTQNKQALIDALDHHFAAFPWQAQQFAWVAERYALAFQSLRMVAEASTGHLGHKNTIWLGRGFPSANIHNFSADGQERVNSAIQQTIDELREARITLYTIDPAGVMTDPGKYGSEAALFDPFGGDPDFQNLARLTGGRNLYGRNDVDREIGTGIRDGRSLYTLAYYPTDEDRDLRKYHKITVTVDRPGLLVVTRPGYYLSRRPARVGKEGEVGRKLVGELIGAEKSNMVYDGVPFTLTADAAKPMSYRVHIEPGITPWYFTSPRTTKVEVLVTAFDRKGKEVARSLKVLTFSASMSAPIRGPMRAPLNFTVDVPPDPTGKAQSTRARVVLRMEASGRIGTADVTLGQDGTIASNTAQPDAGATSAAGATPAAAPTTPAPPEPAAAPKP